MGTSTLCCVDNREKDNDDLLEDDEALKDIISQAIEKKRRIRTQESYKARRENGFPTLKSMGFDEYSGEIPLDVSHASNFNESSLMTSRIETSFDNFGEINMRVNKRKMQAKKQKMNNAQRKMQKRIKRQSGNGIKSLTNHT